MVSIVVPTYKRPDLLKRLLRSIANQTYMDCEVLVVDDNSPDRQAYREVIETYSKSVNINFLVNDSNRGAQFSRNRGVSSSHGQYIAFVDDDDEWLPEKLERQVLLFESSSQKTGLVYTWANSVDSMGNIAHKFRATFRGNCLPALLEACFIPSPSVMVRREAIEAAGRFDERLPSCQDWDMWTMIARAGYELSVVEEVLALHHKHEGPTIGTGQKSLNGYLLYYDKHSKLYVNEGMERNLSEKYRALGTQFLLAGEKISAKECFRRSLQLHKANLKSLVRLVQTMFMPR